MFDLKKGIAVIITVEYDTPCICKNIKALHNRPSFVSDAFGKMDKFNGGFLREVERSMTNLFSGGLYKNS